MNKTHHWKVQTKFSKCTNFQSHRPKYREVPSLNCNFYKGVWWMGRACPFSSWVPCKTLLGIIYGINLGSVVVVVPTFHEILQVKDECCIAGVPVMGRAKSCLKGGGEGEGTSPPLQFPGLSSIRLIKCNIVSGSQYLVWDVVRTIRCALEGQDSLRDHHLGDGLLVRNIYKRDHIRKIFVTMQF